MARVADGFGLTAEGIGGGAAMGGGVEVASFICLSFVPRFTRCCLMSPTASCTSKSFAFCLAISSSRKKIGFKPGQIVYQLDLLVQTSKFIKRIQVLEVPRCYPTLAQRLVP